MEILLITVILMIVFLLLGVPVPFSFGAAVVILVFGLGYKFDFLLSVGYSSISSVVILAIPLFILAGSIMEHSKIGKSLTDLIEIFVGKRKGGLGSASVVACAIFGAISGSGAATLSCIGSIMMPKLRERRYPTGYAAALLASAAPLGLLIPPSMSQILYAWISGQSVLACFLAIVGPGILLTIMLCIVNTIFVRKFDIDEGKEYAATQDTEELRIGRKVGSAVPALIMPIIILGGIYSGLFTPTESAAVSVIYAIPVGIFVYKALKWQNFKTALCESGTTTGVVMVMLFMVMQFSRILTMENIPAQVAEGLLSVSDNKIIIMIMVNIFMILIGMLMDDTSGLLISAAILVPITTAIGIHPVHFAAILGVNLGMGNVTPPTAPLLYMSARVCNAKVNEMMKVNLLFILFAWLPVLLLTTFVPEISLFLPKLFFPKIFMAL